MNDFDDRVGVSNQLSLVFRVSLSASDPNQLGSEGKLPRFLSACECLFLGAGMQFSTRNNFSTTPSTNWVNSANKSQKATLELIKFSDYNTEGKVRFS